MLVFKLQSYNSLVGRSMKSFPKNRSRSKGTFMIVENTIKVSYIFYKIAHIFCKSYYQFLKLRNITFKHFNTTNVAEALQCFGNMCKLFAFIFIQ